MKRNYKSVLCSIFALSATVVAVAQSVVMPALNSPLYQQMKLNGTLPKVTHQVFNTGVSIKSNSSISPTIATSTPGVCDCLVPIDPSFTDVPFTNGTAPFFSNDDGFTTKMALPFSFNYYGTSVDSIYINNNGNISFDAPYFTFTADSFPSSQFNMIAPFWADVDTRGGNGQAYFDSLSGTWITPTGGPNGRVRFKMTPTSLIIKWDSVGYFPSMGDKRNTFQLIITDGNDPLVAGGNNVAFCYGDMQWTTGSASGGQGGFGGTASTTGINKGNGVDYFQLTRNDHDSTDYDGPYGAMDGVSFLDNTSYFFTTNTGSAGNNIPPIALTSLCDTIFFDSGDDSTTVQFVFIGPENLQTVSATLTPNPDAFVISSTSGIMASLTVQINSNLGRSSVSSVEVVATDNLGATTTQKVYVVNGVTGIKELRNNSLSIFPNPTNGFLNVKVNKAGHIRVINALGTIILNENVSNSNQVNLDLTNEANGIYFVQYNNGKEIVTQKFIKE
jgi:hypothetical protein